MSMFPAADSPPTRAGRTATLRGAALRFAHEVAFPRQLAFGVFFLECFGDNAACRRQERLLATLPAGTVGHALHTFLRAHGFRLVPGYQRHDLKHVLLGFDTSASDEMRMQVFMTGNGGFGKESAMALLFLPWTPDMWAEIPRLLLAGRLSRPVGGRDFEATMREDLAACRAALGVEAAFAQADVLLARLRRRPAKRTAVAPTTVT